MGSLRRLCGVSMMGVLLVVSKEALAFLPNFELVSLLVILFTLSFGGRMGLGAVGVFLGAEDPLMRPAPSGRAPSRSPLFSLC